MAQAVDQTTIDLTLEDNTPPPVSQDGRVEIDEDNDLDDLFGSGSEYTDDLPPLRAPPFNRREGQDPNEPITISDSDDEEDLIIDERPPQPPDSPEVQWVGQRPIPRRLPSPHTVLPSLAEVFRRPSSQPELRRATPPELRRADAQSFRDTLRNVPGAVFNFGRDILGAAMGPVIPPTAAQFPHFGAFHGNNRWLTRQIPTPLDPTIYDDEDDYAAIDLDYHDVGFPMNGGLDIIDPAADEVAAAVGEDAYKPPPIAKEGFTRDIQEENDVLVCVACEDELATGEDDLKQQVWVAKSCGHVSLAQNSQDSMTNRSQVFCGSCASQRVNYRKGNDRDRKGAKRHKVDQLKTCKAPNCNSKLTGKTAMFQIYL